MSRLNSVWSELAILSILSRGEPLTMRTLANHVGMAPPSMTTLINRLVVRSLVERESSGPGRRVIWVRLSPRGWDEVRQRRIEYGERIKGLSDQEQVQLVTLLERIIQGTQEKPPPQRQIKETP